MADAGFEVPESARPKRDSSEQSVPRDWVEVFESAPLEEVAARGYDVATESSTTDEVDASPLATDPLSQWINTLSPESLSAFQVADLGPADSEVLTFDNGEVVQSISTEGCNYVGLEAAWGDVKTWFSALGELNSLTLSVQQAVVSSEEYVTARDAWIACLETSGYPAQSESQLDGSRERAIVDRACRDRSDLNGSRSRAYVASANQVRERIGLLAETALAIEATLAD